MALNANQDWLLLFAAAHSNNIVLGLPARAGTTAEQMATDIDDLEALRFLYVKRCAGGIDQLKLAPFGWGHLRNTAGDADTATHGASRASERTSVIQLGAKPYLRLVEPWS